MAGMTSLEPVDPKSRHLHIRIDREGQWYYQNTPIRRGGLVKLFASVLRRGPDGAYWLVTPTERGLVDVEDTPFVITSLYKDSMDRLIFISNMEEKIVLGTEHPLRLEDPCGKPRPYILVREGIEARVLRAVFYQMVALACAYQGQFGLWSGDYFAPLCPIEDL